jgi:hypothetical protein
MKFLSMALIVAITMLSLSGCSKDDDDNGDNAILTLTGLEGVNFISECIYDWDCSKKLYMSISTGDSEIIDCENLKDFDIQGFASSENASLNYMTYDRQKKLLTAYYDVRYSSSRMETATVSFYTKNKH